MTGRRLPEQVYVYGGGAFGEALAKAILDEGSSVLAFLDAFILESPIDGIPVLRPEAAAVERSIPVLNSVLGHGDLDKHLRDLGFAEVFSTESAFRIAPAALRNLVEDGFMWRASTVDERVDPQAIADLMGILTDATSRDLLQRLNAFRQEPSYKTYPWPTLGPFYFPQDVPFYNGLDALRVIDCGAFDGDTLRRLSARFGEHLASYLGVEANPDNAALLRQHAALLSEEWTGHPDSYRVEEAACAEFDGLGFFMGSGTIGSLLPANQAPTSSGHTVRCLQLDSLRGSTRWNVVIMDIEGAEVAAIDGAANLIRDLRPHLAISVYHRPDHLWEIPRKILDITDGSYDLYLRQEGHWGLETVLYAIPQ